MKHIGFCFLLGIAGLVLGFNSCKKDPPPTVDLGMSYFPVNIGHYVVYNVDSTVYDDFDHDTDIYRYQIKEIIESEFTDNEGRPALRIERWIKNYNDTVPYSAMPWTLSRVWYAVRTLTQAERVEENVRYIRLVFPVKENTTWNGNAQNTIGAWDYEYENVDEPFHTFSMHFDSALTVAQKNDVNLLEHRFYEEHYARNVGLVEKTVIDVRDTALVPGVPVLDRIFSGYKLNYTFVESGN